MEPTYLSEAPGRRAALLLTGHDCRDVLQSLQKQAKLASLIDKTTRDEPDTSVDTR